MNSKAEVAKKNIVALAVFALFRGAGVSTFTTLFPLYMLELGYGMSGIGAIASLSTIPGIILLPIIGVLIDSVGRKPIAVLAGFTVVSSLFIPAFTGSYAMLLLAYTLYFFSFLAGQPSRSAMLADSVDEELGMAFAKTFMPFHAARAIVPFVAGYLAELYGYSPVFLVFSLLTTVGTLFFTFYSVEPQREKRKIDFKQEFKNAFTFEKHLLALYVFATIDRFAWQLWFPLLNAHLKEFGMSTSEVGILNSITSGVLSTSAYFSGSLIDRIGSLKGFVLSETLGIIAALLLSLTSSKIVAILPMVLIGFSFSLWIPAYNVAVATGSNQQQRGKAYSKMNTVRTAFSIPAPQVGGFLYDTTMSSAPFILSIILMMINISVLWHGRRKSEFG